MSTRSSLAYIEYPRIAGSLHIYFQMGDCRYYMQDEQGGMVELPRDIAKDFAKILNDKYKYLIPKDPMREEWERKRREEFVDSGGKITDVGWKALSELIKKRREKGEE